MVFPTESVPVLFLISVVRAVLVTQRSIQDRRGVARRFLFGWYVMRQILPSFESMT